MRMPRATPSDLMSSDFSEFVLAAKKLASHASVLLDDPDFDVSLLKWIASFAAIYLLVLDRTHWRTHMLTALLIPYIFLSLPSVVFDVFRGEVGRWIAIIAVVVRLFSHRHFPDWLEMPAALILLIVVAPSLFASVLRFNLIGLLVCLVIACYLLQEHVRKSGGFKNSFTKAKGVSNSLGIILLLVFPVWALLDEIL